VSTLNYTLIASLLATPILAEQTVTGTIEDHYSYYTERVPETKRVCETVQVPVYETRKKSADGGDVLGGMIIGGLLGKALTGNDKGAGVGAVIGGVAGAERNKTEQVVTGYRDELQCETVETYREVERDQYEYSILTFRLDGAEYSVSFIK
jgi:uncharacterized protein YcfJ